MNRIEQIEAELDRLKKCEAELRNCDRPRSHFHRQTSGAVQIGNDLKTSIVMKKIMFHDLFGLTRRVRDGRPARIHKLVYQESSFK